MIWGYLQQFWEAIVGVGEYTIEFFESIGNAVAGAVGGLFDFVNHSISDVFIFGGWLFSNLRIIFENLFLPIRFTYNFLKSFVAMAFSSPTGSSNVIWSFGDEIIAVFESIPHWATFSAVIGVVLLLLTGMAIIRQFRHL